MKKRKFIFEISTVTAAYDKESCKAAYGGGYNPDIPREAFSRDDIGGFLNDGVCHCLLAECKHLAKCKCEPDKMTPDQKRMHNHLKRKTRIAKEIQESYRFARESDPDDNNKQADV